MRPLGPLGCTRDRSTPSSRANLRTEGEACALATVSSRGSRGTGRAVGAADTAGAGAGFWGFPPARLFPLPRLRGGSPPPPPLPPSPRALAHPSSRLFIILPITPPVGGR